MTTDYAAETAVNGAKEPKVIRMSFGNGPEWGVPIEVIKTFLASAWDANPEFMAGHLQYALTGQAPKTRGKRGAGGA